MALVNIIPSDPLGEFVFPISTTLGPAGLEVLVPKAGILSTGNTAIMPLNFKLWLPPSHFGLLLLRHQQARKGVTISSGIIDPDRQEEAELLHKGSREEYAWGSTGASLDSPLFNYDGKWTSAAATSEKGMVMRGSEMLA